MPKALDGCTRGRAKNLARGSGLKASGATPLEPGHLAKLRRPEDSCAGLVGRERGEQPGVEGRARGLISLY